MPRDAFVVNYSQSGLLVTPSVIGNHFMDTFWSRDAGWGMIGQRDWFGVLSN